jgi:hypothetical protein
MRRELQRHAAVWFGFAGVWAVGASLLHTLAEPAYYAAASLVDYAAVISLTGVFVATGVALILLWRDPVVGRGSFLLLLAGIGAVSLGLGNLFEDAFNIEAAVWAFFGGGLLLMLSLLAAGVAALTADSPGRWSGVFLLFAVPGGMLGFGAVMMAGSWILFGFWLVLRHRAFVAAVAAATLPALAITTYLYL